MEKQTQRREFGWFILATRSMQPAPDCHGFHLNPIGNFLPSTLQHNLVALIASYRVYVATISQ